MSPTITTPRPPDELVSAHEPAGHASAPSRGEVPLERSGRRFTPWRMSGRAKVITVVVVLVLAVALLWAARSILQPFFIALAFAYILNPLVNLLCHRLRLPRTAAVALVYVLVGAVVVLVGVFVLPLAVRQTRGLGATLVTLLFQWRRALALQGTISILGADVSLSPLVDELTQTMVGLVRSISAHLLETLVSTVETVLKSIIALVVTFYLLKDGPRITRSIHDATPLWLRWELGPVMSDLNRILGRFVRGEVILVGVMSLATWLTLSVLGIRYALVLGLLAGVLELIPFAGPIIAAIPAVALALVQHSPYGWSPTVNAGVVALAYFILRHAEDYFVIPQVIGRAVELHPVVAMFAAFCGLAIGSVLGMLVGIPLAAVAKVILIYLYHKLTETPEPEPIASEQHPLTTPAGTAHYP